MDSYYKTDFLTGFTGLTSTFILPHFPEENEETRSDFIGNDNIKIDLLSEMATNMLSKYADYSNLCFLSPQAIGTFRLSSGKPEKIHVNPFNPVKK